MSETTEQQVTQNLDINGPMFTEREYKFSFKKQKVKDELGQEVKRPPITVTVKVPTFDGLIHYLGTSEKVQNFMLDLAEEAIKDQVRAQLSDEEKPVMKPEELDHSKLFLDYIASIPKAERTGGGISKDTWEDFEKDYVAVMGPIRQSDEKAAKAAKLFTNRFNAVRTDKPVLKFLREQLGTWAANTQNLEDFQDVFTYLDNRVAELLNRDSAATLETL